VHGELVPVVVPGASASELAAVLEPMRLVGSVIDGESLGLAGSAVARLVGEGDDVDTVDEHGHGSWTPQEVVRTHLAQRWPQALIGAAATDAHALTWPCMRVDSSWTVAVTPPADLMLGVFAGASGLTLHEARVGDRLLVGVEESHDMAVDILVDVLVNAKGRSVVLWRTGTHTGLHVMRRGKNVHAHLWEPTWTPFGPEGMDEVRDVGVGGDAAAIGALLDLPSPAVVSLRAMMRRPDPDLDALVDVLDLPSEVTDVLTGRTTVAQLPGGHVPQPRSLREEISSVSEHDPAWVRWYERGARELRPWYVVSSLVSLAVGVLFLTRGALGGDAVFWRGVGLVMVLGTAIDLPVRWWRRRRR
jgi:hypothetical protein